MDEDKIELFYRANFINPLKTELFRDFTISLLDMVNDTYPGDDVSTEGYYMSHFKYCFNKVIENFNKEELFFNGNGKEIIEYFYVAMEEAYYKETDKKKTIVYLKNIYDKVFNLEDMNKTQSDLDIFIDIYKKFLILFTKKEHAPVTNTN